ncbi:hypothetical protein [Solibacillus daqui]|uniref:hypothetical protein n=1 Tax=Solibacillus daqui TaxID=2912187 RepID=UPI002365A70A|nr:hypothetical protein [Solibacillus daqui]
MNSEYIEHEIESLTLKLELRTENSQISFKDKKGLKIMSNTVYAKIEKEKLEALYYTFLAIILSIFLAAIPKISQIIVSVISMKFEGDFELIQNSFDLIGFAFILFWLYRILKKYLVVTIDKIEKFTRLKGLIKLYLDEY